MSGKVPSIRVEDFLIQAPIPTQNPQWEVYLRAGIPMWVYKLAVTKLNFKNGTKAAVDRYTKDFEKCIVEGTNLIICSDGPGSGKSTLLFKFAMQAVDLGYSGICFAFSDLISLFREIQNGNTGLKIAFKRKIQSIDFVVVDDMGGGHVVNKSFVKAELSDMIYYMDTGELHKTAMLISSQIPQSGFLEYMTESAINRLQADAVTITLTGEDIRL